MTREKITTEHTPESWEKEIKKHQEGVPVDIYARSNYPELQKREKNFAEMFGTPDTALFNAGMAAIYTVIEAEDLKPGDIVLCGKDVYSQTKTMYQSLEKRGIKIELYDSGDMEALQILINDKKPRLIIFEDIANSSKMQVADIKKIGKMAEDSTLGYKEKYSPDKMLETYFKNKNKKPLEIIKNDILSKIEEFKKGGNQFIFKDLIYRLEKEAGFSRRDAIGEISKLVKYILNYSREKLSLIIDNTLASPALYNPAKDLDDTGAEFVIVESATKHYQEGKDKITMGIAYSNNEEKIKAIKMKRTELGTYLQPINEKEIPDDIIQKMPEILKRHAENALDLARSIDNSGKAIEVNHPNLMKHAQNDLAKEMAPGGLTTLFYMKVANAPEFVKKLKEIGSEKIGVGGSFGHGKTWVLNIGDQVRVAAGNESREEFEKVIEIFKKALG